MCFTAVSIASRTLHGTGRTRARPVNGWQPVPATDTEYRAHDGFPGADLSPELVGGYWQLPAVVPVSSTAANSDQSADPRRAAANSGPNQ